MLPGGATTHQISQSSACGELPHNKSGARDKLRGHNENVAIPRITIFISVVFIFEEFFTRTRKENQDMWTCE